MNIFINNVVIFVFIKGIVEKMCHKPSGTVMAVKRITATVNSQEQKRLLMDLDISMRSSDCPYTVHFYGALFREGDVWICMEVQDIRYKFISIYLICFVFRSWTNH